MSVFEVLASEDAAEQERIAGTRAVIATQERIKTQFEKFVSKARNDEDRATRLAMIDDQIRKVANEIAGEYLFPDEEHLYLAGTAVLGGGHASDCGCGFCKNKGNLPGSKKDDDDTSDDKSESDDKKDDDDDDDDDGNPFAKKSSTNCDCACENCKSGAHCSGDTCVESKHSGHPGNGEVSKESATFDWERVAADTDTLDTYVTEREKLPSQDASGLGDTGAVVTDKSRVPDKGLKAIDVPSKMHPLEQQAIHATPDYGKDLPGPSETGTSQDVTTKGGPDSGDATKTWTGTEGFAPAVTSRVAKWAVTE